MDNEALKTEDIKNNLENQWFLIVWVSSFNLDIQWEILLA